MISYQLPDKIDEEINKLDELIARFKRGGMTDIELKVHRVPFGVYEQRKAGAYMVRIRCGASIVTPLQLKKIAELSSQYAQDKIHLTTRQELQVHFVELDGIIPVIKGLREVGLASRGGGGNTVRNIIAPEDAGVDPAEAFDVTPYAVALTERLIAEDDSWTLPRKFKIAFSGSPQDKGNATISDIGFIARIKDGQKGFKVYAAGGLGVKSIEGKLLLDFVPEDQVYAVSKAIKTLFWKYGNRRNKHNARMRFLWQSLGEEEFKKRFTVEYEAVQREGYAPLEIKEIDNTAGESNAAPEAVEDKDDFELWKSRFVRPQKQEGLFSVLLPMELGFINNDKAVILADFLSAFGENVIRITKEQNFFLRNIPGENLTNVYNVLKNIVEKFNQPLVLDKIVSCTGATTCQLGVCHSRGAAAELVRRLIDKSDLDLDKLTDAEIKISGCPNSCGQHPLSDLGFYGMAGRKDGRLYPAYKVVAGTVIGDGVTALAEKIGEVSAKDLPKLGEELIEHYLSISSGCGSFREYMQGDGKEYVRTLCLKYKEVPDFDKASDYYSDFGSSEQFSLAGKGSGECSAGLFDLIDVDRKNIKAAKEKILAGSEDESKAESLLSIVFYASRMLLITRGVETESAEEIYGHFKKIFIETGLVDPGFNDVVEKAKQNKLDSLLADEEKVYALADRVGFLYDHMNNAFQFEVEEAKEGGASSDRAGIPKEETARIVKDLRGVACPMNFVKTKMELSKLQSKEILEIHLDDGAPIDNVPGSVKEEGHRIIKQERTNNYWTVVIEKK